jgi:serine/threonine protein kinase
VDVVSEVENALGAELLRAELLRRERPKLGGRYVVERVLGRGASGLVVAAVDERLNRPVALKIRPVEGDSAMLAEARALARLGHPNVVRIHDVETVTTTLDGRDFKLWLVSMEHIEGRTMRAWLREKPRSSSEVLGVFVDVARGLAAAHAERIVHRDVKPDNVIVRADGVAQVLDFGFAVQAASTQSVVGGLRPAAGTDPYMSPEARLGRTTRKSDQFSLGVALVEALTGSPVPAGSRVPSGVAAAVWKVAQRATSPDPEDRFADMKGMVDELLRVSRAPTGISTAPIALGATAVLAVAFLVVVRPWETTSSAERPSAPSSRSSEDAAPTLQDGGTDTSTQFDTPVLEVSSNEVTQEASPDASSSAAEMDASASLEPRRSCGALRRRVYDFHTTSAQSDAPNGCYVLTVRSQRGCSLQVRLERAGFGATPRCETRSYGRLADGAVELEPDGGLVVSGDLNHRNYTFDLRIVGGRLTGEFHATGGGRTYGGTVTDDQVP